MWIGKYSFSWKVLNLVNLRVFSGLGPLLELWFLLFSLLLEQEEPLEPVWRAFSGKGQSGLVFVAQVLVIAGMVILPVLLPGTGMIVAILAVVLAVLMGLHGNDLRRWNLRQRGYSFTGIVAGQDVAEAERRLFTALGPHIYLS